MTSRENRSIELFFMACTLVAMASAVQAQTPQLPELAWTERSDWINVKTDVTPAAVGDGSADDTAALQAALNAAAYGETIYFPPGTYKITETITLIGGVPRFGINLVGHGRTTTIEWHGDSSDPMVRIDGNPYGRYTGLTLRAGTGAHPASNGFYHLNATGWFETSIRYKHVALHDFAASAIEAVAGDASAMAETSYENCIFENCGVGMKMGGFNDYNHTFVGCDFIDCDKGIESISGNFLARDCYFSGSTIADIYARPQHGCSMRRCKSVGSVKFLDFSNSVSPCIVQDCYVSDWTSTGGAITQGSTPMVLCHNRFVNPPDAGAPVRCTARVVACDNAAPQSSAVVTGSMIYTVPAGSYPPVVGSTLGQVITSFVDQSVEVPPVVFDVTAPPFNANGNDSLTDTGAIQAAIDAARVAGGGAIAYVPRGTYLIDATLNVTGSNYVFGGCGYSARLEWNGPVGGTMVRVTDPSNVRMENILVGHLENGVQNNGLDIEQTSTGAPSTMTYEGVYVFGKALKQPDNKGLLLNGLGAYCTVVMNLVEGNVRLLNSADATVIGTVTYEGAISVDDSLSARAGFLGFMTRLSTANDYGVYVRNSNDFVVSDWYFEQADNGLYLIGTLGNPPGRVSVQGADADFYGATNAKLMTIGDYNGEVFFGGDQPYVHPPVMTIAQGGTVLPLVVLYANLWYETTLADPGSVTALANQGAGNGVPPADNHTSQTLTKLSATFDDFQLLGTLDLALNFPYLGLPLSPVASPAFSPPAGAHVTSVFVTISSTPGATMRYTTDGSTPSRTHGTLYTGAPVWIAQDKTLKAIAFKPGLTDSSVTSGAYSIWQTVDVGSVGTAGSASLAGSTFTVAGAGGGITGTADAFRSVYRQVSGDCTIIARVVSCSSNNTNARAGVMMRQSNASGAIEASSLLMPKNSRAYFHRRTTLGGSTSTDFVAGAAPPYWVRLERTGDTLKAFKSANGINWTQVGSSTTVDMNGTIHVGLAVTSGTTGATLTATLDNVSITQP